MTRKTILALLSLLFLVLCSCTTAKNPGGPGPAPTPDANGFYSATSANVTFKWKITGSNIDIKMSAPTTGWVSVGFNSSLSMTGADVIMGYVTSGTTAVASEMYSTGQTAPTPDATQNLTNIAGTETAGTTEVTFTRPLNTGFGNDKVLAQNMTIWVIFAHGPNGADNFTTIHSAYGGLQLTLY